MKIGRGMNVCKNRKNVNTDKMCSHRQTDRQADRQTDEKI